MERKYFHNREETENAFSGVGIRLWRFTESRICVEVKTGKDTASAAQLRAARGINAGVFPNYDPEVKETVPVSFKRSLDSDRLCRALAFSPLSR